MRVLSQRVGFPLVVFDCDFNNESISDISLPEGAVIYTTLSVCEVKGLGEQFIKNLIKLKPRLVVHLEAAYLDRKETLIDIMVTKYIKLNDYNTNFDISLNKLSKEGVINIHHRYYNIMGRNPLRPVSLYIWSPN